MIIVLLVLWIRGTPYGVVTIFYIQCMDGYYLLVIYYLDTKKKRKGNGKCIQFAASALHVIVRLGWKGQKYLLHLFVE